MNGKTKDSNVGDIKVFYFEVEVMVDPFDDPEFWEGYVVARTPTEAKEIVRREVEPIFNRRVKEMEKQGVYEEWKRESIELGFEPKQFKPYYEVKIVREVNKRVFWC